MNARHFVFLAITTMIAVALPCAAQGQESSQPQATVTGSGSPGHLAVWKTSTSLGNSGIVATGGNVGIGTNTPAAKLEVNGNAQVDGNFSLSGSIYETGVGQLLWAPNDGSGNLSLGLHSLPPSATGMFNVAVGDSTLQANTDGHGNTAIGANALATNTTGYENTALGWYALYSNTTGADNTAIGLGALYHNTSGQNGTAVGINALGYNTTGYSNTAIGNAALNLNNEGSSNTATGGGALGSNTSGSNNTATGDSAMVSNTVGMSNTAVGESALGRNSGGSNNIAIGFEAGYNITASNNIDIGNAGLATDNGVIRIGTGVGCDICQTSAFVQGIYGSSTSLANVPVVVDANGNLGTVQSSRRYKEEINDMADSSDGLMQLRPVKFRYKKAYEDGSKPVQYGLIAEEVEQVYPDLVARSADGQIESVRYQLLDPMLLNELQKQHATIAVQKEHIQVQDRRIEEQAQAMRSMQERLAKLEVALLSSSPTASH